MRADRREALWDEAVAEHEAARDAASEGRLDEALSTARRALRGLSRAVGPSHPDHANAEVTLGRIFESRGEPRKALPCFLRAVAALRRRRAPQPIITELTVDAMLAAAAGHQSLGAYAEGRKLAKDALRRAERHLGADSPLTAAAHNQLGVLGKFLGRFEEAERHYEIALPVYRARFGPSSREVAALLHNVGGLAHARGRFAEGEPPAREAVEITRRLLPPSHPERLAHEVAHAAILDGLGRHDESIPIYRRALAAFTRHFGRDHYEVASTLQNLAAAEHSIGRLGPAERHYVEACELLARLRGEGDSDLALTRYNLAILHRDKGHPERATQLLRAAQYALRSTLGARHPTTRSCAEALAQLGAEAP